MALEAYANQPSTSVTSGGTGAPAAGTVETWTVASSASFPAASTTTQPATQFHVADASSSASSELIAVTVTSGTTWTVTRGAEGTTPVGHGGGFTVYQVVSAGAYGRFSAYGKTPWITLPDNWYDGPWFTAKTAGFASPAWILFDGDSITNGLNPELAGYLATGWPDQLRSQILSATGAQVYGDFYAIWAYTQGVGGGDAANEGFPTLLSSETQYEGGFGSCLTPSSSNAWFQIISTGNIPGWTGGNVTGFDLVYYDYGSCTWGFTIDSGEGSPTPTVSGATWNGSMWVVTNTGGGQTSGNVKKVTVSGLTAGTHAIEYGQVNSAGNMMILGISIYTGDAGGIGFVRSAYSGRRAVDSATPAGANAGYSGTLTAFPNDRAALWSGYGPTNATAQITPTPFGFPTQPTLAFIGYGVNDCACWVSPDAYSEAVERKIIAVRRGVANANIALVAFCYPDVNNSDNDVAGNGKHYSRWKRATADLAASYNCAFIDIDSKWGGTPVGQGFMSSGNIHPNAAGHIDIATSIAGIL